MEDEVGIDKTTRSSTNSKTIVKINPMKLTRLVRAHEELYNSSADGYNDKIKKDIAWEQIYRELFPLYHTYKQSLQELIQITVRRRWKTLRDSVSREVKRSVTVENYTRKKESPIISELEFLIPHIKSSHCAKLADELGLRDCYASTKDIDVGPQNEESFNDLIDLTEECDIKPFIKQDGFEYDDMETCDDTNVFSPQVNIDVGDNSINSGNVVRNSEAEDSIQSTWNKEFCTVAEFKGGEFFNAVELCADQEAAVDQLSMEMQNEAAGSKSPLVSTNEMNSVELNGKRSRNISGESTLDLQAKILQLLTSIENRERSEQEAYDEDRMFLLSLVSDLKRVPAAKKMRIKMEIVTAIARANQCQ